MNDWFFAALAFVCICNVLFLVAAAVLLHRIVSATEDSRSELLKAAKESAASARELLSASTKAIGQMERASEAHLNRENSTGRVISELSRQIRQLGERMQDLQTQGSRLAAPPGDLTKQEEAHPARPDERARVRAELNDALSRNKLLQDEISHLYYRLQDSVARVTSLQEDLRTQTDTKQAAVKQLSEQIETLRFQLEEAQARAKASQHLADDNAQRLADLQAQLASTVGNASDPATPAPEHLAAMQDLQDRIETMAAREKALLERIAAMEAAFERTQAEKNFIEDRFLQIDAAHGPDHPGGQSS